MTFVGVPFQTLATVGGAAAALVVVFYILKLRRRPVAVPFSRIWDRILRDKEATSLFSQLKRLLSLLLQLVLLTLLLMALGDPRSAQNLIEGRNVVVLIDASASMQATDVTDKGLPKGMTPTRLEVARKRARDMARGLGASDRMLIAQMDATLTPLSTLTSEVSELEAAVNAVKPSDTPADYPRALRFAADTLRGLSNPEVIVVSDGALGAPEDVHGPVDLGDVKLSYEPIPSMDERGSGSHARNAAITQFSVRRYPLDKSRYEVMLELTNTSNEDMDVELSLYGDGLLTDVSKLKLKPKEPLPRFYPNLSGASRMLEARIQMADGTHDDLPVDDHAFALLPERRRARVQVVTEGNMYLEAALLLDEYLDVTTIPPSKYPADGAYDVTIFDGVTPAVAGKSGSILYLDPKPENVPFEVGKEILDDDPNIHLGFDLVEEKHPIVRHTRLNQVQISRAHVLKGQKEDLILGASTRGTLLLAGSRNGAKFVALGFDVRQSDFPMRIAWPLFLLNTINYFVEEDTGYISSFNTGTVWRIPAPSSVETATLVEPDGSKRTIPVDQGRAIFLGQKAGIYTLQTGNADPPEESMFAANLADPVESAIDPQPELKVGAKTSGAPSRFLIGVRKELWVYFLAAVIALSAIEWLTFHRRFTV